VLVEYRWRALYITLLLFGVALLRDQDWKARRRKMLLIQAYFNVTSSDRSRALIHIEVEQSSVTESFKPDHMFFNFLHAHLVDRPVDVLFALRMQCKRTMRNTHRYCYKDHNHRFMPACSLITTNYNCLLEIARIPSTALRAWATHVFALSQEAKLAASAIVGQQSSGCHAVPIAKT
jgi:hypothetical protein